ncbi:MAG: DUF5916 domain-containing protein [Acidobacteriota bacterium]
MWPTAQVRIAFGVWSLLSLQAALGAAEKPAEQTSRQQFTIRPASSEIRINGVLDEPAWEQAEVIVLGREWAPGDNTVPPVATECLVTFDDDNLYVAFRASDPEPTKIRARLADRDVTFSDDTVGFLVDTFNSQREAFEFRVNPLGVQMDGTLTDIGAATRDINFWQRVDYDGIQDWSWDAIWSSAGKINGNGYVVEMAVPFRQLRFAAGSGPQTWGFLATRHYPRNLEYQLRSSTRDFDRNCQVCQFDTLAGLADLPRGENLEINPTVTSQSTETLTGAGSTDDDTDVGLSVRWGITPNILFNATLNPDFSQVEADIAQLDVNERFALFFPEKRPFFLDGAEIFASPIQAVYTRTIADPTGGLKLTGRQGKNSFGLLFARDRINNLSFPSFQGTGAGFIDEETTSGAVRLRRSIGKTSNLGLIYTGREGDIYSNHVLGVDGRFQVSKSGILRFQYLASDTRYPEDLAVNLGQPLGSFNDDALEVSYNYQTRNWLGIGRYRNFGEDFRADHGFLRQAGLEQLAVVVVRSFWGEPDAWYTRLGVQFDHIQARRDDNGERFDESSNITFIYEGPKQSIVQWAVRKNFETFLGQSFDNPRTDLYLSMRPSKRTELEVLLRGGKIIDFFNVRQADFFNGRAEIRFKLGRGFTGELSHLLQELSVDEGTFLIANLTQATLIYHFNDRAFIRAIVQYNDTERIARLHNVPSIVEPNRRTGLTQGLFSYKLNARTVLFVGYSDNHLGTGSLDLDQTNRTFFLKLGYAWVR